jgi:hypothetical protein
MPNDDTALADGLGMLRWSDTEAEVMSKYPGTVFTVPTTGFNPSTGAPVGVLGTAKITDFRNVRGVVLAASVVFDDGGIRSVRLGTQSDRVITSDEADQVLTDLGAPTRGQRESAGCSVEVSRYPDGGFSVCFRRPMSA